MGLLSRRAPSRPTVLNPNDRYRRDQMVAAASEAEHRRLLDNIGLTAAGFRVGHEDSDQLRRLIQPWQARSFSYYDQLGEIWYASQFYARMMSLLRLYPAKKNAEGEWEETEDERAVEALARIRDPGGGDGDREGLLSSYGRLQFVSGEGYLLCSVNKDTNLEQWEMLSTDELRVQSGVYVRYRAPTMAAQTLHEISDEDFTPIEEDEGVVYRLWRRHPRYSMLADAPMKGVLDLCEELLLLTRAVRARARSRLAGPGLLAISEDFSMSPVEATPDEDMREDPFMADLTDAMTAPITNEGAASAVVPIVIRGPSEAVKDGIKHIQIIDPTQLYPETGLRYECVKRIAIGLDLPPEILLGMTDANHWTGWIVDDQTWKAHGQPASNQLVNDLTTAYFLPELRSAGVSDWDQYSIQYDASAVVNHPDRGKDAKDLFDRVALSKEALRDATGFDESDAPSDDERAERVGILTHDSSLAWNGEPTVKAGGIETSPDTLLTPAGEVQSGDVAPATGAEVEPGPPSGNGSNGAQPVSGAVVGSALDAARFAGAADMWLRRCREVAGNRLLGLAKRDPALKQEIEAAGVRAADVPAFLGPDRVRALAGSEYDLIANARAVLDETLTMWQLTDEQRALLMEQIERHAIRTLYDERPTPLPPRFHDYVAGVLQNG